MVLDRGQLLSDSSRLSGGGRLRSFLHVFVKCVELLLRVRIVFQHGGVEYHVRQHTRPSWTDGSGSETSVPEQNSEHRISSTQPEVDNLEGF